MGAHIGDHPKPGYNARLFSNGIRKWAHEARFHWLHRKLMEGCANTESVLELGCFDARSISYIPKRPVRYWGFDANWEGGLDSAKVAWQHEPQFLFVKATKPEHLESNERADCAISLETLEHISPDLVDGFIARIATLTKRSGLFLVTVPNEKGFVFLAKYLAKRLLVGGADPYSFREILNATFGRMNGVARVEHKGFDWEHLRTQLEVHFEILEIEGVQVPWLPPWANAQIGFVMQPRHP